MIEFLTHVAVYAKDMEETLDFYDRAFGFKKIFELPDPATGEPWIVYIQVAKGQFLELFYTKPGSEIPQEAEVGLNHICFCVDDVDAMAAHLEAQGFDVFIKPCVGCDNNRQTWVKDPNGVRIELMKVSPDSPHARFM